MTVEEFGTEAFGRLKQAIMRALDVPEEKVLPSARFEEDLEADSFDMAMVLTEVDEVFATNIPSETTEYIRTVEDLMNIIPEYPAARAQEKPVRWSSGF